MPRTRPFASVVPIPPSRSELEELFLVDENKSGREISKGWAGDEVVLLWAPVVGSSHLVQITIQGPHREGESGSGVVDDHDVVARP